MLLQEFLEHSAARLPEKCALICDGERWTYQQIDTMANRLANAMRENGLKRGDRVVIYLQNSVEAVIGIFATLKADCIFVPVNPTTKRDKLAFVLNNCRAAAILFPGRQMAMIEGLVAETPSLKFALCCDKSGQQLDAPKNSEPIFLEFSAVQSSYPDQRRKPANIDLDLAALIYTSGTTGDPKGVMCDHSNMVFAANSIFQYISNVEEDIVINLLPISFDYGLYQLLMTFQFGGTLVLERGFAYPAHILQRMEAERVTGFPGVPTIFAILLQMDLSPYDLTSLRYITNTAAALPPSHIQQLRDKFPHAKVFSMYGLTETKRTLYLPPEQLDQRPGSVGIAIPGTEVWIEDDNGLRLGPGEIGELVVRGRHVMPRLLGKPKSHSSPVPSRAIARRAGMFFWRFISDGRRGVSLFCRPQR